MNAVIEVRDLPQGYEGAEWLGGLEAEVMPLLDGYSAVVVEDTVGLWSRWPGHAS